jgi:hypothetical protein
MRCYNTLKVSCLSHRAWYGARLSEQRMVSVRAPGSRLDARSFLESLHEVVTPRFIDCMCVDSSLSPKRRVNRFDFFRPHCCCRWKQVAVVDAVSQALDIFHAIEDVQDPLDLWEGLGML